MEPSLILRTVLIADAVISGATGLLMAFAASPLGDLLGLPVPLLQAAGIFLTPFACLVAWLGLRKRTLTTAVWAVIWINTLWAVDCAALLLGGLVSPTRIGIAFVAIQAVAVGSFAALQYAGLRRMSPALSRG